MIVSTRYAQHPKRVRFIVLHFQRMSHEYDKLAVDLKDQGQKVKDARDAQEQKTSDSGDQKIGFMAHSAKVRIA